MAPIFHLAFPAQDLERTKAYYLEGLGCELGRENRSSAILNLQGHQLVAHLTQMDLHPQTGIYPRHFGLVFDTEAEWQALLARAQQHQLAFYQQPQRRFQGSVLEHLSFFWWIPVKICWSLSTIVTPRLCLEPKSTGRLVRPPPIPCPRSCPRDREDSL